MSKQLSSVELLTIQVLKLELHDPTITNAYRTEVMARIGILTQGKVIDLRHLSPLKKDKFGPYRKNWP